MHHSANFWYCSSSTLITSCPNVTKYSFRLSNCAFQLHRSQQKKSKKKCELCICFIYSMHNTFPVNDLWKYMCMKYILAHMSVHSKHINVHTIGWLRLVGSLRLKISFAKKPYKKDDILQKGPIILRSLLTVAKPYVCACRLCKWI